MKVRHTVLFVINWDYNSEKSADFWHVGWANYTSRARQSPTNTTNHIPNSSSGYDRSPCRPSNYK
jgi:hypothetical protein